MIARSTDHKPYWHHSAVHIVTILPDDVDTTQSLGQIPSGNGWDLDLPCCQMPSVIKQRVTRALLPWVFCRAHLRLCSRRAIPWLSVASVRLPPWPRPAFWSLLRMGFRDSDLLSAFTYQEFLLEIVTERLCASNCPLYQSPQPGAPWN